MQWTAFHSNRNIELVEANSYADEECKKQQKGLTLKAGQTTNLVYIPNKKAEKISTNASSAARLRRTVSNNED